MASYWFVGDGTEVLACEAYEENARDTMRRLELAGCETLNIYECDPSSVVADNSTPEGLPVWEFPAERACAEKDYDLPTIAVVIAREQDWYRHDQATRL